MLTIPRSVRVYLAASPVDMRKSIDGLVAIAQGELRSDPYSGHLFVFVGRRRAALASRIAWRSVPAPESAVEVTV